MKKRKFVKKLAIIMCLLIIGIIFSMLLYVFLVVKPILNNDYVLDDNGKQTVFYALGGEVIEDNFNRNIKIEDLNDNTINAFLSIEDKDFYKHNGINLKRIAGATLNNIKSRQIKEGASTITQQLVKNKYLSNEKSLKRKIREAFISMKIEKKYTKNEILVDYLNTIYFGNGAYGLNNASRKFFNKSPIELTLSESCVLAGCINSPYNYSPINNIEKSKNRRDLVLKEMYEDDMITKVEYESTVKEDIQLNVPNINGNELYLEYSLDEASKLLNKEKNEILSQGYTIYTYQNNNKQKLLNEIINDDKYYAINDYGNIADSLGMIINNENYSVSAVSGRSKYNLVNFKRQPGSLIKPIFTYAPALEEGIVSPITQINDEKIDIDGYSPNNVGNKFNGYVSVRDSLSNSLNIPTIKITQKLGIEKCKEYANKCGIVFSKEDVGYSIALGGLSEGVTLKDIVDSYSVFTSEGDYVNSSFVDKIIDANGVLVYSRKVSRDKVFNADTAYLMTEMLTYASKNGTSKKLKNIPFQIASKTGTVNVKGSNYNTDAYSLGYTTTDTICFWLGNYSMDEEYVLNGNNNGGTYATEMLKDVFLEMYKDKYPNNFKKPDSIIDCNIDSKKLNEDHVVSLANNTPERYIINENFSSRYAPTILSDKFISPEKFYFDIKVADNKIVINFNCFDYNEYSIFKNDKLLYSFSNENINFIFEDDDVINKKKYTYYILARNKYSNLEYITDKKSIYFETDYDTYQLNNFDFIFT